ncbi:MAG: hypothetical protein U9M92_00130 [Patescibacteria group bacterium]|nr:hypothetical protein [Patescibacteria group bacterium]
MQVLTVIPIARGIFKDHLTYFSAKAIKPGAIVSVLIRKRPIKALVVKVEAASDLKQSLRRADFALKKIRSVDNQGLFQPAFLKAAELIAPYSGYPLGPVLKSLTPQKILNYSDRLEGGKAVVAIPALKPEKQLLQDTDTDRLSFYKSLIREEFAKGNSIFLCLPTALDIEQVLDSLGRGIAEYTIKLHNGLGAKQLLAEWQKGINGTHPLLIIGTPPFLSLPRPDIKTIIVDKENSSTYKLLTRPYTDYRRFAEYLAEGMGARLIFGDLLLRVETLERSRHDFIAASNPRQRLVSEAENKLLAIKGDTVIGEELTEIIQAATNNNERTVILTGRRGLSSLIVCDDCSDPVICKRCQSPIALHQAKTRSGIKETHWFLCHKCGERRSAEEKCQRCDSWRLRALGAGIEKIATEIKSQWPKTIIFPFNSDELKTQKQAKETMARFLDTPGSILLGTEMVLHYLPNKIENTLVVAMDSLFSLPDFRINEKLFTLLSRLRMAATKRFAIQTRYPEQTLFDQAIKGNLLDFYRAEISERRRFDYPPLKLLVKISREGDKAGIQADMKKLVGLLEAYEPIVFPSLRKPAGGGHRLNLLIKLPPEKWPDETLSTVLQSLPPSFIVEVDPEIIF